MITSILASVVALSGFQLTLLGTSSNTIGKSACVQYNFTKASSEQQAEELSQQVDTSEEMAGVLSLFSFHFAS